MPATFTLTYLSTGHTEETWLLRGVYYELADGSAIDVTTHIAWCGKCREFTDGESAGISSTEFANWFYTPEGDHIPRNATLTY